MKTHFIITTISMLLFCLPLQPLQAQKTDQKKKKKYISWLTTMNSSSETKGYLSSVDEDHIVFSDFSTYKKEQINIPNLESLAFRKNGKVGKGILYGTLSGLVLGTIIGSVAAPPADDCGAFQGFCDLETTGYIFGGAIIGAPVGALIGGLIGSAKIKIPINGNQQTYKSQLKELEKYSFD